MCFYFAVRGLLRARALQHPIDRARVDPSLFGNQVAQVFDVGFAQLGKHGEPDEQIDDLGLLGLLDRRTYGLASYFRS